MVGLNQESIANCLAISQSQYSRIESQPQEANLTDIINTVMHIKQMWDKQYANKLNVRKVIYNIATEAIEI